MINLLQCKKCGDIIYSKHRHDMVSCRCGAVAIDGGADYCKITGEKCDWDMFTLDDLLTALKYVPKPKLEKCLIEINSSIDNAFWNEHDTEKIYHLIKRDLKRIREENLEKKKRRN